MSTTTVSGISVRMKDSRMKAVLIIPPDMLRDVVTVELCVSAARNADVVVSEQVLDAITEAVNLYHQDSHQRFEVEIAKGTVPVNGQDGWIEWEERFDPDRPQPAVVHRSSEPREHDPSHEDEAGSTAARAGEVHAGIDESEDPAEEDDRVDFYQSRLGPTVSAGEYICTIHEPTAGKDGETVNGVIIAAKAGQPVRTIMNETVEVDGYGRVTARISGLLHYDERSLRVLELLEIPGYVDFSTGHVQFDGDVVVQKGIRDRFEVRCTGDLIVNGLVEAASIHVEGDAILRYGMAGRQKGVIDIGADLMARYLDSVNGTVRGNLTIEREIINCTLDIGRSLLLKRGSLIGGRVVARGGANLENIGSEGNIPTTLIIGIIPELERILQQINAMRASVNNRIKRLEMEVDPLRRAGTRLSETQARYLKRFEAELLALHERFEQLHQKRGEIRRRIEKYARAEIVVTHRVYTGVTLILHHVSAQIKTKLRGPVRIGFNERMEAVVEDLITNHTRSLSSFAEISVTDEDHVTLE